MEESGIRLAGRRSLSNLILFIWQQEVDQIRQEISGKKLSVIFDGTTCNGEAMAIILRFVTDDWVIQQRLVQLQLLVKCLTGEEIARELISVLQVGYGIGSEALIGSMHDRASTNNVAMTTVKVLYPEILDVGCFSHSIHHIGERFCTPIYSDRVCHCMDKFVLSSSQSLPRLADTHW